MDFAGLLVFAGALFAAAASPGPGIAAVVARVLGRGFRDTVPFSAGVAAGDLVWLAVAVLGLAALAQAFQPLFLAIKYAGVAYLLYLAWRLWTAPAAARPIAADRSPEPGLRVFLAGLALTLGNPKVMVFYVALLPTLIDVGTVTAARFAALAAVTLAVLAVVFAAYMLLAARARLLFASPRATRAVNRTGAALMAGAAGAVAAG